MQLHRKGHIMSKYEYDRYEGKYGDRVKSRQGRMNGNGQYDVKDTRTGDHHFLNTQTGVQGTALGGYRPGREQGGNSSSGKGGSSKK